MLSLGLHFDILQLGIPAVIANVLTVFMCLPLAAIVYILDGSITKSFMHLYSSLYFCISILFPASMTFAIFQRQRLVIKVLENMKISKTPKKPSNLQNFDEQDDVNRIRSVMQVYSDLLLVIDEISLCYGIPMLLVTGVLFFYSLMTNFVIYKEFFSTGTFSGTAASSFLYVLFFGQLYNAALMTCSMTESKVSYHESNARNL